MTGEGEGSFSDHPFSNPHDEGGADDNLLASVPQGAPIGNGCRGREHRRHHIAMRNPVSEG